MCPLTDPVRLSKYGARPWSTSKARHHRHTDVPTLSWPGRRGRGCRVQNRRLPMGEEQRSQLVLSAELTCTLDAGRFFESQPSPEITSEGSSAGPRLFPLYDCILYALRGVPTFKGSLDTSLRGGAHHMRHSHASRGEGVLLESRVARQTREHAWRFERKHN